MRFGLVLVLLVTACSAGVAADPLLAEVVVEAVAPAATTSSTTSPTSTTAPPATTTTSLPLRSVSDTEFTPFARVGDITLFHPSARVETIGFHESGHDGAQQMIVAVDTAASPFTMETRERDTVSRGAADIVVDPTLEIYAPVTGTVKRAGTYVLYCEYSDDFAVIAPDEQPTWEVKILHINQVQVRAGDRVEAGVTRIAIGPTPLPFVSQVDETSWEPSWAHVHIEVVDPSIPDRPSGGGC